MELRGRNLGRVQLQIPLQCYNFYSMIYASEMEWNVHIWEWATICLNGKYVFENPPNVSFLFVSKYKPFSTCRRNSSSGENDPQQDNVLCNNVNTGCWYIVHALSQMKVKWNDIQWKQFVWSHSTTLKVRWAGQEIWYSKEWWKQFTALMYIRKIVRLERFVNSYSRLSW